MNPAHAAKFEHQYFQNGCIFFTWEGRVKFQAPGFVCIPLKDGRLVSASANEIRMIHADGQMDWEIPFLFHHQIRLSEDGQRILALGSVLVTEDGKETRYDEFAVISLEGKILARNSLQSLEKEFLDLYIDPHFSKFFGLAQRERSHFNSIFEIGRLTSESKHPAIKEGNVVINSIVLGTYILSPDLKKVLLHFRHKASTYHQVHDVQVLPNGNFLLFNNHAYDDMFRRSAAQEVDGKSLEVIYDFGGEGDVPMLSSHCGGIQKLDDEYYLLSHMLNGAYIFSRKSGRVIRSVHLPYYEPGGLKLIQNLRLVELSPEFQQAWFR